MPRRYRVSGPRPVLDTAPGDEFEADLTAEEERTLLGSGRVALVPRRYRVVGDSTVFDTKPDGVLTHAFPVEQERALVEGGHIEPLEAADPFGDLTKPELRDIAAERGIDVPARATRDELLAALQDQGDEPDTRSED